MAATERSTPAEDIYVGAGHALCSDTGPGTAGAPYCSIGAALAAHHAAGVTIHVMPGVYREQVTLDASGAPGRPIVLRAEGSPDRAVVIDGADDFSDRSLWRAAGGAAWLAPSVVWAPAQVLVQGVPLRESNAPPG